MIGTFKATNNNCLIITELYNIVEPHLLVRCIYSCNRSCVLPDSSTNVYTWSHAGPKHSYFRKFVHIIKMRQLVSVLNEEKNVELLTRLSQYSKQGTNEQKQFQFIEYRFKNKSGRKCHGKSFFSRWVRGVVWMTRLLLHCTWHVHWQLHSCDYFCYALKWQVLAR